MFGIGKQKALVGLDIGSSSVKAVELKQSRDGFELVAFGLQPLARNAVVDNTIVDQAAVVEAVARIFEEQKIKPRGVATSVSGHSVIVKRVTLPAGADEDLVERIQAEAGQHIPFDISDVTLSYEVLETESADRCQEVLLVAAKKDKLQLQVEVISQAGGSTEIVDIDAFALQNCFEMNYAPDAAQTVALLDIGASVMNIAIARGGQQLFTHDVSIDGNQYTEALGKEFGLGFQDGEKLKKGEAFPSVNGEQRQAVLRAVSQTVILEIQKTLDFFRATASGESIECMYVSGGSARVPGLVAFLREEFSVPVEEIDPFRKIRINPARHREDEIRESASRFAIAVGLALRGFETP